MAEDSGLIELVEEGQKSVKDVGVRHPLQDALVEVARGIIGEDSEATFDSGEFGALVRALTAEQQELVKRAIRDEIIEADGDTSEVLRVFRSALEDCKFLGERPDDLVRRAFRKMLERRSQAEMSWVADTLERCPELLKNCKRASRIDFRERVGNLIEDTPPQEVALVAERLGKILKLKKKERAE